MLELVELLDGPVGGGATGVFADAAEAARSVLAQSTVADVAEAESRAAGAAMYHIWDRRLRRVETAQGCRLRIYNQARSGAAWAARRSPLSYGIQARQVQW